MARYKGCHNDPTIDHDISLALSLSLFPMEQVVRACC